MPTCIAVHTHTQKSEVQWARCMLLKMNEIKIYNTLQSAQLAI